jgi:CHRD domain
MSKISRRGLRVTAAVAGAGVIAAAAWATTAHGGPAHAATSSVHGGAITDTRVHLTPMPQGTVTYSRDSNGHVDVTVSAFGLTPGSSHAVLLMNGRGAVAAFRPLTANSLGQARGETLDSSYTRTLGSLAVAILKGNGSAPATRLAIARTGTYDGGQRTYQLIPVETGEDGRNWGTPQGSALIAYDRTARTISVTVNATGFAPGAHAAHIHVGSCVSQGRVEYMLADYTANAKGQIVNQTRVVTHVTAAPPATGWYFNLHEGNSGNILFNGSPTINFRPLLCGDI